MERSVDVSTGDGVVFSYELAGLGSRFFAVFIDLFIQVSIVVAGITFIGLLSIGGVPAAHTAVHFGAVAKVGAAIAIGLMVAAGFALFDGYFILFEWLWCGRTPGKRLLGIRVVRDGGFPVDLTSSVIRNAIRMLEFAAGFYAISAVATLLSPRNRRLGDMAAGTMVVRDAELNARNVPAVRQGAAEEDAAVRDLSEEARDLVRRYAARRAELRAPARDAVAADIASVVRPRLGASFAHLDDDTLLMFLATTALR